MRLQPAAFPELPGNVILELNRRGCQIPQSLPSTKRSNVIQGQFTKPGQTDWAVLCSVDSVSSILVFRAGSDRPGEIGPKAADRFYVVTNSDGTQTYTRTIQAVRRTYIMDHYRAYGGPKTPPIDHHGIDDSFLEKASVVHYYYRGKLAQIAGRGLMKIRVRGSASARSTGAEKASIPRKCSDGAGLAIRNPPFSPKVTAGRLNAPLTAWFRNFGDVFPERVARTLVSAAPRLVSALGRRGIEPRMGREESRPGRLKPEPPKAES